MRLLNKLFGSRQSTASEHKNAANTSEDAKDARRVVPVKSMFICSGTYHDANGLYLIAEDGTVAEELARPASGERFGNFAVSPDGKWVAYTAHVPRQQNRDPYPTIRVVPAAGGRSQDIVSWDPHYETCYQNAAFAPSGEKIICEFGLRDAYNPDLRVLDLYEVAGALRGSSSGVSIINPLRIGNHSPQFLPDSERVAYFGNFAYEDLLEVCLYDPNLADHDLMGEVGWRLTGNADGVWRRPRAIAVQPEWEQIFFIQGHTRSQERICVFLLSDLPPGGHRKIFDSVGGEHDRIGGLEMSTDGLHLAYDADGAIYIIGSDGSNLRRVSPDAGDCRCARFSKDGARIAHVANNRLYIADVDSGKSLSLSGDGFRIESLEWT